MLKKRLIATLLMRDGLIVQSIGFNRYLPIGRPRLPIEFVVKWDVDEIVLLDMSASPQGRGPDSEVLEMLDITQTSFTTGPNDIPVHTINVCFTLKIKSGVVSLDSEHNEYGWFTEAPETAHSVIKYIFKKLKK